MRKGRVRMSGIEARDERPRECMDEGGTAGVGLGSDRSRSFQPAWWLRNRHWQTVWNRLFRRSSDVSTTRARWTTPDGDFLDIDFLDGPRGAPQLLVIHGLEGSSERKYVRGLLDRAAELGWRGIALNFRSCSGVMNRAQRLYHSGETEDLNWVVEELTKRDPGAAILPVGVSLGGNVLLKWLGEQGAMIADEVRAAATISVPYDLAAAAEKMSTGLGRIYSWFFLRTLKEKALAKAELYPEIIDAGAIRKARSWRQYDEVATAPLHGFEGADDYWFRSSSKRFLTKIRCPTLLISARDDPFIPESSLPVEEVADSDWLHAEFTERGGHVGFVTGRVPWNPIYWAERRAIDFLSGFVPTIRRHQTPPA